MKYLELRTKLSRNIFTLLDVVKFFPKENAQLIKIQLFRFREKKLITKIKKGLYCFEPAEIDELELSGFLYQPSYISLETALNYYAIIPDVSQAVTSVCLTTTKSITNQFGNFFYAKLKPALFFGYVKIKAANSSDYFNLARREKALLDYFYLRRIKLVKELRLNLAEFNLVRYHQYASNYPRWVQRIKL